jgi:hypothetical protein
MSDTGCQIESIKLSKREQIEKTVNKLAAFCTAKIPQKTIDLYINEKEIINLYKKYKRGGI